MRIAGVLSFSMNNGPGIRYVIFCQGCLHKCPGCHNPETWDFGGGMEVSVEELLIDISKHPYIDGITLSGGDPFYQQEECVSLLSKLPKSLDVWIYTGFLYEDIKDAELAKMADYIVDGPFEKDKVVIDQLFGSSNQRIIPIKMQ